MPSSSKTKGNTFERELVNKATDAGLSSTRAYASDGRSLGRHETVDLLVDGVPIQAKRRARVAAWLKPDEHVDAVAVREDRGEALIVIRYDHFLELMKAKNESDGSSGAEQENSEGSSGPDCGRDLQGDS